MEDKYQGRKYQVADYNEDWKNIFEKECAVLKSILGVDGNPIEHIGSTAVPGLIGKPTIDILVTVEDFSVAEKYRSQMEEAGYKYLGEYVLPGTRLFVREKDHARLVNVHFFPKNHPHIEEMLVVRDYLRTHPEEVKRYGKLKLELAEEFPDDYGAYRKKKDEYMKELLKKAKEWRTSDT